MVLRPFTPLILFQTFPADGVEAQPVSLSDAAGNALTSSTTPAANTDRGLHTRRVPLNSSVTVTLDTLDETITIPTHGTGQALISLDPTTLDGVVTFQGSYDDEANYSTITVLAVRQSGFDRLTGTETISGATARYYLYGTFSPGLTHARLKVTTYNSGNATAIARVQDDQFNPVWAAIGAGGSTADPWIGGALAIGAGLSTDFAQMVGLTAVQTQANINPGHFGLLVHGGATHNDFGVKIRDTANAFIDPLTDAELRAAAVPVTANAGTNLNTASLLLNATMAAVIGSQGFLAPLSGLLVLGQDRTGPFNVYSLPLSTGGGRVLVDGSLVTQPTKEIRSATPSVTAVADSATNVTLLAANANRLGACVVNDSSATLYLKLGATASVTSYTVQLVQNAYYEVPFGYTGIIDGIWASDPNDGAARVTQLTA